MQIDHKQDLDKSVNNNMIFHRNLCEFQNKLFFLYTFHWSIKCALSSESYTIKN